MPLLLTNDHKPTDKNYEVKLRIAATEARCVPKQANNDEGSAQDLQIRSRKAQQCESHPRIALALTPAPWRVDNLDNPARINRFRAAGAGLH
jgi:hypothetical protein